MTEEQQIAYETKGYLVIDDALDAEKLLTVRAALDDLPNRDDCFRQTTDLPDVPDSTFLGINRDLTIPVLRDLRSMGLGGAVLFASGF